MCQYCNNNKDHQLMHYDNRSSMNVYYGQYQGVMVASSLVMKGNMLMMSAGGNYRSRSDCYYEDMGLDCDGQGANRGKAACIKIKYCPFCGKELNSKVFENKSVQDKIDKAKEELNVLKRQLEKTTLYAIFRFPVDKRKANKLNEIIGKQIPMGLEELYNFFGAVKVDVKFIAQTFTPMQIVDGKLVLSTGDTKYASTYPYALTDEQYMRLGELSYLIVDIDKLSKLRMKRIHLNTKILQLYSKIDSLKKKLK